jgi:hypothetical protein
MMRKLFKPGKGQKVAQYVAAYVNGTAVYRGDLVCWDFTAPTDQGSSGVLAGETLGAKDFIFVILPPAAAAGAAGLQAGIVEGKTIGDRVQSAVVSAGDTIAIVQTYGVHDNVWVDSTDTVAGALLGTGATTGESTLLLATDAIGTDSTIGEGVVHGFALTADATTHVRGTTTNEEGVVGFVKCM